MDETLLHKSDLRLTSAPCIIILVSGVSEIPGIAACLANPNKSGSNHSQQRARKAPENIFFP